MGKLEDSFLSCDVLPLFEDNVTDVLQTIIGCMYCGIVIANTKTNFVIWNSRAKEILGKGPEDIPTEEWASFYGLFHADGRPFNTEELPLVRALAGEFVQDIEMLVRNHITKEERWISVTASPIEKKGELAGGVAVFKDISEMKMSQIRLLETVSRMKDLEALLVRMNDQLCH